MAKNVSSSLGRKTTDQRNTGTSLDKWFCRNTIIQSVTSLITKQSFYFIIIWIRVPQHFWMILFQFIPHRAPKECHSVLIRMKSVHWLDKLPDLAAHLDPVTRDVVQRTFFHPNVEIRPFVSLLIHGLPQREGNVVGPFCQNWLRNVSESLRLLRMYQWIYATGFQWFFKRMFISHYLESCSGSFRFCSTNLKEQRHVHAYLVHRTTQSTRWHLAMKAHLMTYQSMGRAPDNSKIHTYLHK